MDDPFGDGGVDDPSRAEREGDAQVAGPEKGLTDALGHLVTCDAGACTVRTRQADVVIPLERVVAAKEVPPAPERRRPRA